MLRPDLEVLIARIAELEPRPRLSMTTDGIGLAKRAAGLAGGGLVRINVSLDTVDPGLPWKITRRDRAEQVVAGLTAAREAGLDPVKINAVSLHGVNEDEAAPLLRFSLEHGYHLRFIAADAAGCATRLESPRDDHRRADSDHVAH